MIYVKIKKEDFGKTMVADTTKLPSELLNNNFPNFEKVTIPTPLKDDTLYIGIYCHFDGYPSGVGKELKKKFNDYEKALNLVLLGDCSSIIDGIQTYHNRDNEDYNITITNEIENSWDIEYNYIFENGKWKRKKI
jgi:hypothetical protein